jgi:hypothetical protein
MDIQLRSVVTRKMDLSLCTIYERVVRRFLDIVLVTMVQSSHLHFKTNKVNLVRFSLNYLKQQNKVYRSLPNKRNVFKI